MALSQRLLPPSAEQPPLDVLIVGAGPVGLLAAAELSVRGSNVRIIDMNESPVLLTKASGIAERSMEILPQPVVDSIFATSRHVKNACLHEHDGSGTSKVIGNLSMDTNKRGLKGMRSQMQWMTEKALTEHLESLPDNFRAGNNMKVERPCELVSLKDMGDGVECELKHVRSGSTERVVSKFLLGCDGGSSLVRKSLGFSFDGETTPEYFFALHAKLSGYVGEETNVDMYFSKGDDPFAPGFGFAMPMPDGGYLMTLDLDESQQRKWVTDELDRHGSPILRQPEPDDVVEILRQRGCGPHLAIVPGSVKWIAHFRVNSRQSNHYGKGRVFLAGDACHCHSPLGGQGMNMGFNDAKNIAWKLAFASRGTMPVSILNTYESERQPIEHKILLGIERAQKLVSSRNPIFFWMRGRGQRFGSILLNFAAQKADSKVLQYGTQQAWTYATSPLSFEHWERPILRYFCARKDQNLHRWIGTRVRAGDTVPDAIVGSTSIFTVLKRARGWTLMLFEGSPEHNDILAKSGSRVQIFTFEQLQTLGESLKIRVDPTGYVAGIDEVIVVPAHAEAQVTFGVRGQCLYLIRPDLHVALRSEPLRRDAVIRYFDQQCCMKVSEYSVPRSAPSFDFLPVVVHGAVWCILLAGAATKRFEFTPLNVFVGVWTCLLFFLFWASRPRSL
eukprot:TRINITY_DN23659_c0_g1_i1.p1 TRINITY_DN23659_c0_g1~~TRINITY_DN23659_c0_g1_i1.p1  ORF type:complete len:673 (-),score=91.61 TRINITY_DN23659_c0_g1_i1:232-2250(-)